MTVKVKCGLLLASLVLVEAARAVETSWKGVEPHSDVFPAGEEMLGLSSGVFGGKLELSPKILLTI